MSWVVAGVAAATAVYGAVQADKQRKAQQKATEEANRKNADITAAQTQYSPWTGLKPQEANMSEVAPGQDAMAGAVQGGLGGAMFGQQLSQGMADRKSKAEAELEDEFNKMQTAGAQPTRAMQWSGNSRGPGSGTMNG